MPLRISLPGQIERIQSMSFQLSEVSNCDAVHSDSLVRSSVPLTWPTMLPKLRRLPRSTAATHDGLLAKSSSFDSDHSGGTVMPFLMSWWRCPITCRSTVSTSALHLAAIARSISDLMKPRSFMTYSWNQNGLLTAAAMSSIEQIDIVLCV